MKNTLYNLIQSSSVYDVAVKTPCDKMPLLSKKYGHNIFLKREDLQPVFSFKLRGAYNKIANLSPKNQQKGIVAASAGNHAQGVALSAKTLDLDAIIVMPKTTPSIKVAAVKRLGAKVVLFGDNYDQACEHAKTLCKREKMTFIHPYDDEHVIAGQGTIGLEIIEQLKEKPDKVFIAVGGGGLISGVAIAIKALSPTTKIIGVEPENAASMTAALKKKKRVTLDHVGIFADGVAVKQVGELPYKLCLDLIDDMITVTTDEICAGIKDIFDSNRTIPEPAGAVGLAGLKKYCENNNSQKETLVTIECGANMNFDRLRHVAERAEIGEQKEALFAVTIPEKPGSFKTFCNSLGKRSITEFNYRFNDENEAHIFVGIELSNGFEERDKIKSKLENDGYKTMDLTDNETAKLHLRHMVGGKSMSTLPESIYRVQFPERPGALLEFLAQIGKEYNISMFHYRNHGADFGRVLLGIQGDDTKNFELVLNDIGFYFINETKNNALSLFL